MTSNHLCRSKKAVWLNPDLLPPTYISGLYDGAVLAGVLLGEKKRKGGAGFGIQVVLLDGNFVFDAHQAAVLLISGSDVRCNHALACEMHRYLQNNGLVAIMHLYEDASDAHCPRSVMQRKAAVISVDWADASAFQTLATRFLTEPNQTLDNIAIRAHDPVNKITWDESSVNDLAQWLSHKGGWHHLLSPRTYSMVFSDFGCIVICGFLYGFKLMLYFETDFARDAALRVLHSKFIKQELRQLIKPGYTDLQLQRKMNFSNICISNRPHRIFLLAHWNSCAVNKEISSVLRSICHL